MNDPEDGTVVLTLINMKRMVNIDEGIFITYIFL
jgi:hypothetical protein